MYSLMLQTQFFFQQSVRTEEAVTTSINQDSPVGPALLRKFTVSYIIVPHFFVHCRVSSLAVVLELSQVKSMTKRKKKSQ